MDNMIKRQAAERLHILRTQFPVLGILGPRQSGKTTLSRNTFPEYAYVNLESFDTREFALEDPRRFLKTFEGKKGVILDEIQRAPNLLSYIQVLVDENPQPGFFVITGSENILLSQHIGQTLAGRIALTTLLPLSLSELQDATLLPAHLNDVIFQGFYPSLYARPVDVGTWVESYVQTYVERDVRSIKQVTDLSIFQKFLKLCVGRIGQLLDLTSIGNDCGITAHTVRSWLSVLEATYIIFLLQPHHKNFNKRLVKTAKLYFYDTALACYLLGISSSEALTTHYLRGGLFESMILSDLYKQHFHEALPMNLYFWRDKSGHEVDCLLERGSLLTPIEIKSGETVGADFFTGIAKWNQLANNEPSNSYVIYGGNERQTRSQAHLLGWADAGTLGSTICHP